MRSADGIAACSSKFRCGISRVVYEHWLIACVPCRWGDLCKSVVAIDISGNDLRHTGASAKELLASVLELHGRSTLTALNISGCNLGVDGAMPLAAVLRNCK